MNEIQRKTPLTVKLKTVLTNSNCKLFLGLELTSYIQAAGGSKRTDSPAEHSALSEIVSLVLTILYLNHYVSTTYC